MGRLGSLSGAELGQLIECVSVLVGMRRALPVELSARLDSYRAELLAEQGQRVVAGRGGDRGRRG